MLVQRRRRWLNIKSLMGQRLMFAGISDTRQIQQTGIKVGRICHKSSTFLTEITHHIICMKYENIRICCN